MMTSFTLISFVLSLLRQALGLQQTPPNQVLVCLALFLSIFVMRPAIDAINNQAMDPYGADQIPIEEAIARSGNVLHGFMVKQTRETDVKLFSDLAEARPFASAKDIPFSILRSEEHTSELQSLMRISYAVLCLKKKN